MAWYYELEGGLYDIIGGLIAEVLSDQELEINNTTKIKIIQRNYLSQADLLCQLNYLNIGMTLDKKYYVGSFKIF